MHILVVSLRGVFITEKNPSGDYISKNKLYEGVIAARRFVWDVRFQTHICYWFLSCDNAL